MKKLLLSFMAMFLVLGTAMAQDKEENTEPAAFGLQAVTPGDGASVTRVEQVQFIFTKDVTATMPESGIEVKNTETNEVFKLTNLYENEYMPKTYVILQFEQVMAEGKDGKEELVNQVITSPGAYTYTIPAGMIKSADGEAFAEQTFTFNIVGTFPVNGCSPLEASKFEQLELTFSKEIAEVANLSRLYVTDTYYYSPVAFVNGYTISEDKKTVTLTLDNAISEEGWYDFSIPEGIFISADGEINAYADFWLNVVDPTPAFTTNLNDGDRVQELGNLQIGFKNVNEVILAEGKEVVAYLPSEGESKGTATYADGIITVTFNKEFTEEGTYYFVIPEGMFTMDGVPNEERMITVELFTLSITPLAIESVTPGDGEIDQIGRIVVSFNQDIQMAWDEEYQTISKVIYLTDAAGNKIALTENYNPSLSYNQLEYASGSTYAENGWELIVEPITAAGTYTLDLSQIVVNYGKDENWMFNAFNGFCTGTCTWTISGETAVERIEVVTGEQVIYDLLGRRIEKISGAGIYIVNGKKVVIK